jgi:hypothetical protein
MRTTLDIDDDILAAAKELGRAEGKTAGQVISDLVRQAITAPTQQGLHGQPGLSEEPAVFAGIWPTLPNRQGVIITPQLVRGIQDEIDLEDGEIKDFTQKGAAREASQGPLGEKGAASGGKPGRKRNDRKGSR